MKREMRYNIVEIQANGTEKKYTRNNRACFAGLMYPQGVIKEILWDFDHESGMTIEEFKELFTYMFSTGEQYGVQFEFGETYVDQPDAAVNAKWNDHFESASPWTPVRIFNMDDYPRGLMMNKLFMIRNLGRYNFHYKLFKELRNKGVSLGIAAYIGANLQKVNGLIANSDKYTLITYAESLKKNHKLSEVRNAALCRHHLMTSKGRPWKERGGYNGVCSSLYKERKRNSKEFPSPELQSYFDPNFYIKSESIDLMLNKLLRISRPKKFLVA